MHTLLQIPLDEIMPDALLRDRAALDDSEILDLANSIAVFGLRQPIEVFALPQPEPPFRYGLISGLRRLTAVRQARDYHPDGSFDAIPAFLCTPKTIPDAMATMVAENEFRADVTPWDKGRLIVASVRNDLFDTEDAAIAALFPAHTRQKRARLRAFAEVFGEFDGAFTTPENLTAQRMERLAAALRGGLVELIDDILLRNRGEGLETQWAALLPVLNEALTQWEDTSSPTTPGRPRRLLHLKQGLTIRREKTRTGWALVFSGPEAKKHGLMDDIMDKVEYWFQKE